MVGHRDPRAGFECCRHGGFLCLGGFLGANPASIGFLQGHLLLPFLGLLHPELLGCFLDGGELFIHGCVGEVQ